MTREEIVKEIDEAFAELKDAKVKVNEALCHARNIVSKEDNSEAYNKGLEDAWELAKKILYGIDKQLIEIFDVKVEPKFFDLTHKRAIINDNAPQEVLAKLESYEKEQNYIYVGDVVNIKSIAGSNYIGVVTQITDNQNAVCVVYSDGSTEMTTRNNMTKTGKHIDIQSVLEQIGGVE